MKFKQWLLNEDGFADAGGNSWDLLYPTRACDYNDVVRAPLDHFWLQFRWDRGLELGRKLINIDNAEFQKRGYTSIESSTAPSGGDSGGWKHKQDSGKSSVKVVKLPSLYWLATGKTSEQTKALPSGATLRLWQGAGGSTGYEPDCNLRSIFGDDGSGRWPEVDEKYMDAPFKKKYEKYEEYGGGGGAATSLMHGGVSDGIPQSGNANIKGIRSKWNADEAGPEDDQEMEFLRKRGYGFGFRSFIDGERAAERKGKGINTDKGAPSRNDRPDIIY